MASQHMTHLGEAGEKLPVSLLARIYGVGEEAFLWVNRDDFNNY